VIGCHYGDVDDLSFELHFAEDISRSGHVDRLAQTLRAGAPALADDLRVLAHESDRAPVRGDWQEPGALLTAVLDKGGHRGDTFRELEAANPPPRYARRFGEALLGTGNRATVLRVRFDEYVPARPTSGCSATPSADV